MLFTWNTENLCIIFSEWRVTGTWSLIVSILAVMALTAGYEAVREGSRRYEARQAAIIEGLPRKFALTALRSARLICPPGEAIQERSSLLWAGNAAEAEEKKGKMIKAALYGVQVFYSFFIM